MHVSCLCAVLGDYGQDISYRTYITVVVAAASWTLCFHSFVSRGRYQCGPHARSSSPHLQQRSHNPMRPHRVTLSTQQCRRPRWSIREFVTGVTCLFPNILGGASILGANGLCHTYRILPRAITYVSLYCSCYEVVATRSGIVVVTDKREKWWAWIHN